MPRVLVVDDELSIQEFFQILLEKEGIEPTCVGSAEAALENIHKGIFDLIITDLSMPGMDGLALLKRIKAHSPETGVIMMTAYGTAQTAIEAMREGAVDYLLKPFKIEEIKLIIRRSLERLQLVRENALLKDEIRQEKGNGNIVGTSRVMSEVAEAIEQQAKSRSNVLILGASGTGKELVARAIHDRSNRSQSPFVPVNCGAIPENLLESELFGHMRGAFTGATVNKRGLLEVAGRGTFFFDEVGELPLITQVKLLRVLQERKIRRVGGTEDIAIECRILAATNKDLEAEVKAGRFREDLFYRLNVFTIRLPRLAERAEDIPLLVEHFVAKYAKEHDRQINKIAPAAMRRFTQYGYPGNIRELENLVEQAVAASHGTTLQDEHLPAALRSTQFGVGVAGDLTRGLDKELESLERALIMKALKKSDGVKTEAAKLLKITFRSLRYRLRKLGIDSPD